MTRTGNPAPLSSPPSPTRSGRRRCTPAAGLCLAAVLGASTATAQDGGLVRVGDIAGPPLSGPQGAVVEAAWLEVGTLPTMAIIRRSEEGPRAQLTYGVIDDDYTILLSILTGPPSPLPGVDGLDYPRPAEAGACPSNQSAVTSEWSFGGNRVQRTGSECRPGGRDGYAALDYRFADPVRNVSVVWQLSIEAELADTAPLVFLEEAIGNLDTWPDQARARALTAN